MSVTVDEFMERDGTRIYVGFRDKDGMLFLQRCPECRRENYAMAVATGQCAWCGWKEQPTEVSGE